MLEQLTVRNFVLSDENNLEFQQGLSAITGETGAGKSLTVDAISQILGARTDSSCVKKGCDRAEIEAVFSLEHNKNAISFLIERELISIDELNSSLAQPLDTKSKAGEKLNDTDKATKASSKKSSPTKQALALDGNQSHTAQSDNTDTDSSPDNKDLNTQVKHDVNIVQSKEAPAVAEVKDHQTSLESEPVGDEENRISDLINLEEIEDSDLELVIRRVITKEGKSRAWVNSHAVTLSTLKELGAYLVSIHGQHASVKLLDNNRQLHLLDGFGELQAKVDELAKIYASYNAKRSLLQSFADEQKEGAAVYRNLKADFELLSKLDLEEGDYEQISQSFDELQHRQSLASAIAQVSTTLSDDEERGGVLALLRSSFNCLIDVREYAEEDLAPLIDSFEDALSKLDEVSDELGDLMPNDTEQEQEALEYRLSKCHELARRFRVQPQDLYKVKDGLETKLEHFLSLKDKITSMTAEVRVLRNSYEEKAQELSALRQKAADSMSQAVTAEIKTLAMPDGIFKVQCVRNEECRPRALGRDEIEFLFTANRGQDLLPLSEAASGGELSRLALAVEVLTSKINEVPTIIFDEVDTGISGRTASAVGALLRKLAHSSQVFTVTHLPQVAACAHHQFLVVKEDLGDSAVSKACVLDEKGRIDELARMMGGNTVTAATLDGAKALLEASSLQ